jgi:hypothetical protein
VAFACAGLSQRYELPRLHRVLWHKLCYSIGMPSRVVRARLDEASESALSVLMREGRNESDAIRTALVEAGRRRAQRSALAAEVSRLAADQHDSSERKTALADMDSVGADWPE